MKKLLAIAAMAAMTGCASYGELLEYKGHADYHVWVGNLRFNVWTHPTEDTLLVQRGLGGAMGGAMVEGATFHAVSFEGSERIYHQATALVLDSVGCEQGQTFRVMKRAYETDFACPDGVRPVSRWVERQKHGNDIEDPIVIGVNPRREDASGGNSGGTGDEGGTGGGTGTPCKEEGSSGGGSDAPCKGEGSTGGSGDDR